MAPTIARPSISSAGSIALQISSMQARSIRPISQRAARSTDDHRCPRRLDSLARLLGEVKAVRVSKGQNRNIDVVFIAEADELIGWHICAKVMNDPVVVAKGHGSHRGRQRMAVSGNSGHHDGASLSATRAGRDLTEDAFGNRRGTVFDPDREAAFVPVLSNANERGNQHLLDEIGNRSLLDDDCLGEVAGCVFVTGNECRVHLVSSP